MTSKRVALLAILVVVIFAVTMSLCTAEVEPMDVVPRDNLEWHFYKNHNTCKDVEAYVKHEVELFYNKDKSIAPKLLRLLYSDCFVTGCDASILLDGPDSEKMAPQNRGLGGFVVIDKIKMVLESRCPGVVSCADILHLATRDAVHMAGAPSYPVFTGRRDGMSSRKSSVDLPLPSISIKEAIRYFESKGLNADDLGTLMGGHTMGRTHCSYVEDRLYNFKNTGKPDPAMNQTLLTKLIKQCPRRTKKGQSDPLVYLNPESGSDYKFTSSYYSRVLSHEASLTIDQQLLYNDDTMQITQEFAQSFEDFRKSFAYSVSKMGSIGLLTGKEGEIRRDCRHINK
ncbi:probable peroxidase 26 [Rutidosis leptorrhynchoides]|uniref:probable peroxidase 26 n=1 Tax=Rutidosis leptorrhynchoides TaxID=125765 RepID=UPI003A993AA6